MLSPRSHASIGGIDQGFNLNLQNLNLSDGDLSFLTKFMTQFKKIKNIDLGETKIQKDDMDEFTKAVAQNQFIQEFKVNKKYMSKQAKQLMQSELQKNKEISKYGVNKTIRADKSTLTHLDLQGKNVKDVGAVTKMLRDYTALEELNLANNVLGNKGARDIANMIDENNTIHKLILTNCQIGN